MVIEPRQEQLNSRNKGLMRWRVAGVGGCEGNLKRVLCPLGRRREGMSYGFKKEG
ncbi:hypothetical protein CyaNS01_00968 [Cyanobium sp. NS01]|nr:hypothetical protein CyaNS01_00968 [Cyanobium sp. NS01]